MRLARQKIAPCGHPNPHLLTIVHSGYWACPFCQALRFFDLNQGVICGQAHRAYDDGQLVEAKAFCEMALACGPCPRRECPLCRAGAAPAPVNTGAGLAPSRPCAAPRRLNLSHTANVELHTLRPRDGADGGSLNSHPSHQTDEPSARMAPRSAHLDESARLAGRAESEEIL